jgi:hypothetical protein
MNNDFIVKESNQASRSRLKDKVNVQCEKDSTFNGSQWKAVV